VFEAIRRGRRDDPDVSIRELATRHGVHRRTVRQALASAQPPARRVPLRVAPVLDPVKPLIDAMLREDLTAPRKQRHTALRVRVRLLEEHQLVVAYSTVRDYVRGARPRIAAEAGKALAEVFVPQTHTAGAEAEVDFADLWIVLAGVKTKVFLFTLRLSYSGKAVHRAYATASQEAFLDGHRYAFEQLGGIPTVHIRYDNLKAAVSRVLAGRTRVERAVQRLDQNLHRPPPLRRHRRPPHLRRHHHRNRHHQLPTRPHPRNSWGQLKSSRWGQVRLTFPRRRPGPSNRPGDGGGARRGTSGTGIAIRGRPSVCQAAVVVWLMVTRQ